MEKTLTAIIGGVAIILLIIGCMFGNCNRTIIDTTWNFDYAIINLPTGEIVEGEVSSWKDWEDSDAVQVTFTDGAVYYTHLNNVVLIHSRED